MKQNVKWIPLIFVFFQLKNKALIPIPTGTYLMVTLKNKSKNIHKQKNSTFCVTSIFGMVVIIF